MEQHPVCAVWWGGRVVLSSGHMESPWLLGGLGTERERESCQKAPSFCEQQEVRASEQSMGNGRQDMEAELKVVVICRLLAISKGRERATKTKERVLWGQ